MEDVLLNYLPFYMTTQVLLNYCTCSRKISNIIGGNAELWRRHFMQNRLPIYKSPSPRYICIAQWADIRAKRDVESIFGFDEDEGNVLEYHFTKDTFYLFLEISKIYLDEDRQRAIIDNFESGTVKIFETIPDFAGDSIVIHFSGNKKIMMLDQLYGKLGQFIPHVLHLLRYHNAI